MVGTWLTHLFGGSAGREGVAVQLGATVSNWVGRYAGRDNQSSLFLATGMAAGFAGLFQTPIAAIFFAIGGAGHRLVQIRSLAFLNNRRFHSQCRCGKIGT